jgi:glycosyltransferase involved in cell wall biosynthesis
MDDTPVPYQRHAFLAPARPRDEPYHPRPVLSTGAEVPVRVTHVITTLVSGGAERMLERLVLATHGSALEHEVITLVGGGAVAESLAAAGVPVRSLEMRREARLPDPRALYRLAVLLRRARGDVIQGWMYHANLLAGFSSLLAGLPRPVWGIRTTSAPVDRERARTVATARVAARLAFLLARGVVVNGQRARDTHVAEGYPERLFEVIPNGVDAARWRPDPAARRAVRHELGLPDDLPLVGYVANMRPIKDHATFFAAARHLLDAGSPAHFLLAGVDAIPDHPVLRDLVASHGLGDRVHALGERADIVRLTQALDVASMTSVEESFPNVVAEAMACGVPVISTDVGDARAILGPHGQVVAVGDADGIARAWSAVLALPRDARVALGERLREHVRREYSMEAVADHYARYYRRMSPRHSAS